MIRISKRKKQKYITIMIVAIIAMVWGLVSNNSAKKTEELSKNLGAATVERVVDGDTVEVNYQGESKKVRLIGVDTPESVNPDASRNTEFGEIASNFTKTTLQEGSIVYLEFDAQETDKYGRLLAYLYLDDQGKDMFNADLLKKGYARTMTIQPNSKHSKEFAEMQKTAREGKVGFWAEDENDVYK